MAQRGCSAGIMVVQAEYLHTFVTLFYDKPLGSVSKKPYSASAYILNYSMKIMVPFFKMINKCTGHF